MVDDGILRIAGHVQNLGSRGVTDFAALEAKLRATQAQIHRDYKTIIQAVAETPCSGGR